MTQRELIKEYLKEFGTITPAKMAGFIYKGIIFGSETSKRCREMRAAGILESYGNGKFEVFNLKPSELTPKTEHKQVVALPFSLPRILD